MSDTTKKTPDHAAVILDETTANQGHEQQMSRYTAAKSRQKSVSLFILQYKPEFIKEGKNLDLCGSWL